MAKPTDRLRILVMGYTVRGALGGMAWHDLHYLMGFARLGHEAYYVEDSADYGACYDPSRHVTDADPTYGLALAANSFQGVGLGEQWAYYDAHTARWLGPAAGRILEICASADLLVDLSPMDPLRPWLRQIPVRVRIDTDPVFNQVRHLTDPEMRELALAHNVFLSYGECIGLEGCCVPDDGLPWQPTRTPVVLEAWPITPGPEKGKFTTVMQWDSYRVAEYGGCRYGMKSDSFPPYLSLPRRAGGAFELALGSASAPRALLVENGWEIRDPLQVTRDIWTYQNYIQQSKAEFTVAKHGYVVAGTGWFSERSAKYLGSGRPVLTQETGFTRWLPSGAGVLAFRTPDEAMAGVEEINARYEFHCREARAVAREYFDSDKVLNDLITRAFAS